MTFAFAEREPTTERVARARRKDASMAPLVLNMRLRGGGGDGGVYPLTHAEQKVRAASHRMPRGIFWLKIPLTNKKNLCRARCCVRSG